MPFFVKVSDDHCRRFLSHPNTYSLCFPSGHEFFFSLPFDMDSTSLMRPKELFALHKYLSYASKNMTPAETLNTLDVQLVISRRLADTEALGPVERRAWAAGHGYPIFDHNDVLVGFSWDWTNIEFEGGKELVSMYMESISGQNEQQVMARRASEEDGTTVSCWVKNEQEAFLWKRHGKPVCFYIYGAYFRSFADWEQVEAKLTEQELDKLDRGLVTLRNRPDGGYSLLPVEAKEGKDSRRGSERRHSSDMVVPVKTSNQQLTPHFYPSDEESRHANPPVRDRKAQNSDRPNDAPSTVPHHQPTTHKHTNNSHTNHANTETNNLIDVYGAIFEGESDWLSFASTLPSTALYFLQHGVLKLQGCTHNGIAVVWGLRSDSHCGGTGGEEQLDCDSSRDNDEQQAHANPHNILEQLYQNNLLTHTTLNHIRNRSIRQRTQGVDSVLLRVYRDMRDNGTSANEAAKQILQLKEMGLQRSRHRRGKKDTRPTVESIVSCFFQGFEEDMRDEQKHEQESSFGARDKKTVSDGRGDINGGVEKRGGVSSNNDRHKKHGEPIQISEADLTYPRTPLVTATTHANLHIPPQSRTHNPTIQHIPPPASPSFYPSLGSSHTHAHSHALPRLQSTPTPTHPSTSAVPIQKERPSSAERHEKRPRYQAYAEESTDGVDEARAVEGSWRDV